MTTVIVTNIAPGTSETTITEFFGFCGRIVNIRLEDGENSMTAYVTFETENAANTSLLLTNAMIADRAIVVTMASGSATAASAPATGDQGSFPSYPTTSEADEPGEGASLTGGAPKAEPNAATRAIAQLIATGHKLSDTAVAEARALDERYQVSNTVNAKVEDVRTALNDFGERMGLRQKSGAAYEAVAQSSQEAGVTERAASAAEASDGFFSNFARQASATLQAAAASSAQWAEENLPNAVAKLREVGTAMNAQVETIASEAHQLYPGAEAAVPLDPSVALEEPALVDASDAPTATTGNTQPANIL